MKATPPIWTKITIDEVMTGDTIMSHDGLTGKVIVGWNGECAIVEWCGADLDRPNEVTEWFGDAIIWIKG